MFILLDESLPARGIAPKKAIFDLRGTNTAPYLLVPVTKKRLATELPHCKRRQRSCGTRMTVSRRQLDQRGVHFGREPIELARAPTHSRSDGKFVIRHPFLWY